MKSKYLDDATVKTHSSAIQISHKLSLVQHKTWLILLRNAYHELPDEDVKTHKMGIAELATYLGYPDRNDKHLKSLLRDLVSTTVEWNILSKDGEEWNALALLARCGITKKTGIIEYEYSNFLREKLYNPKMFALLNLRILNMFGSKYALAIYNLCKDYAGIGQTPSINVDRFRAFIGLKQSEYPDFKSLNRRVIKEPIKEVNSVSDIFIKVEYFKEKRRVVGLKFFITLNPQMHLDFNEPLPKVLDKNFIEAKSEEINKDKDGKLLLNRLVSFGLNEKQAKNQIECFDTDYIIDNLNLVEEASRAGRVENLAAYTITALKNDYRPKKTFVEVEKENRRRKQEEIQIEKERALLFDQLKKDFEEEQLEKALNKLSKKKRTQLEEDFVLDLEAKNNKIVLQYVKENGFKSMAVQGCFFVFAKSILLKTSSLFENKLKKFFQEKGHDPILFKEKFKQL